MSLQYEFSEFKKSLQAGVNRRSINKQSGQQSPSSLKLWPPLLSISLVCVVIAAALLLPNDGALSRLAVSTHNWPVHVLRKMTNLVLAAPYIALFTLIVILSLVARWRLRTKEAFALKIPSLMQTYHRLGYLIGHSLFAMLAILSAGLVVNILKFFVGRPRPYLIDSVGPYGFKPFDYSHDFVSFPSGHACTAAVLATLLALWLPRYRYFAYAGLALLSTSRIFVQAHYPTDVLMGFTVGTITALILARYFAQAGLLFDLKPGYLLPQISEKSKIWF